MMRVAVVGSGYWGKNLVRNFNTLGAPTAGRDRDAGVLQTLQQMYEGVSAVQSFDYLLGDSELSEAVVIATPADNGTQRENNISIYANV
jgi:UDP-2-acetamido-3-amino-2,3-dideoxy-glucuronate N-acetyltransferase